MLMGFEWKMPKNRLIRKKHGICFEEVLSVFDDPSVRLLVLAICLLPFKVVNRSFERIFSFLCPDF